MQVSDEIELVDLNYLMCRGNGDALLVRVDGDSMCDEIADGDYIILSKNMEARNNDIVVCRLDDAFTIKRFRVEDGPRRLFLVPANTEYEPREIIPSDDASIVGVVTHIIHRARR